MSEHRHGNNKHKAHLEERKNLERDARKLLRSPRFFHEVLHALKKDGLIGEERNALVLFIVAVSRLLQRPLNAYARARSSTGKNFLISRVLRLFPKHAVAEITSMSDKAWNYLGTRLQHTVVYLQERNEAIGNVHPLRLLISEDKIIRRVTRWKHGKLVTKKYVAYGPVASISTGTMQLKVDDATRHISISLNETSEQTRRIVQAYPRQTKRLTNEELKTWHAVQRLLEKRKGTEITTPAWFDKVGERVFVDDQAVRRYYPAFVEACRTVCLIRSFQSDESQKVTSLTVNFADFAIATLIFDQVFAESLRLRRGVNEATRDLVSRLAAKKGGPVEAKDVVRELKVSNDRASRLLRNALKAGVIKRANKPERENRKLFRALPAPTFVPDPSRLFRKLHLHHKIRIFHPITGERIVYRPRGKTR
jgi:hypothetical protein